MKAAGIISFLIAVCALIGCTTRHDARVEAVYALAATEPTEALDSISVLDTLKFSKSDRMLLQLAKIKATDKAYLDLPGDSVILPLVDYYSSHESDRFYPEALYYAGRIYSESGDSPNALRYFQDALDLLPENTPNKTLRGSVLGQTAGLLGRLHLIGEAIPYFEAVIKSDSLLQDTTNLIYDLADYAECLRWADRCDQALPLLNKALALAQQTDSDFLPVLKMYISRIYLKKGDYKTAHKYIIPALDNIEDGFRKDAMVTVLKSYYLNEKYDSAYHLARHITDHNYKEDIKRIALFYLLQNNIRGFSSPDSLKKYQEEYLAVTERILLQYTDQTPIFQRTLYNYSFHDRERQKAENNSNQLKSVLLFSLLITFFFIILCLVAANKAKTDRIKLHQALDYIRNQDQLNNSEISTEVQSNLKKSPTNEDMRTILRNKYIEKYSANVDGSLPDNLANSNTLISLRHYALKGQGIPSSSKLLETLEKKFNKECPDFRNILKVLSDETIKSQEYIILMLIKCGFSSSEIATLTFRAKGSITYNRAKLSRKLFGANLDSSFFDNIIRCL